MIERRGFKAQFVFLSSPVSQFQSDSGVKISICDTGIGLKSDALERIFNSFEQAQNSASRMHPGTGLGLPLTKSLVELHGGNVWAQSEGQGQGTIFSFIIPTHQHDRN
jgi:signal transduction histidine kinase